MLIDEYNQIVEYFEMLDENRDNAIKISREVIKSATNAIIEIHKDNLEKAKEYLEVCKEKKKELDELINKNEDVKKFLDLVDIAYQEYVEAFEFYNIIKNKKIANMKELEINDILAYINGIFDAIGELKRKFFDYMLKREIEKAKEIVRFVEDFYYLMAPLSLYKYTGIRNKVDLTRKSIDEMKSYLIKYA